MRCDSQHASGPAERRPGGHVPERRRRASSTLWVVARIEQLIAELERSFREMQERMSDPSVYNDHREAADVGRRLKELQAPYKLSQEAIRQVRDERPVRSIPRN